MPRLVADENFNNRILRGLLRQNPDLDIVRAQDTPVYTKPDPDVLAWAAQESRVLLTHDAETLVAFAYERVQAGLPMPGVVEVTETAPIGTVINDLLIVIEATRDDEWEGQVFYVPL